MWWICVFAHSIFSGFSILSLYISLSLSLSLLQVPNKNHRAMSFFYQWKPRRWQISSTEQHWKVRPALNRERERDGEEVREGGKTAKGLMAGQRVWFHSRLFFNSKALSIQLSYTQTHAQPSLPHWGVWWHKMKERVHCQTAVSSKNQSAAELSLRVAFFTIPHACFVVHNYSFFSIFV